MSIATSARPWRGLVQLHRDLEATAWGSIVLSNVWPAYVFALPLAARIWAFLQVPDKLNARGLQETVTIVFLALVVILFATRRRSISSRRATWREGIVALLGTFLLNVVAYLPVPEMDNTGILLASSAVVVVGTIFTIWSLVALGRCFGLLPEARGLVRGGPYQLVRHPVYVGEFISAAGILIAKPHPLIVAVLVIFAVLQYWRTIYEERALSEAFPQEYPAYQARVGRLLPGWR